MCLRALPLDTAESLQAIVTVLSRFALDEALTARRVTAATARVVSLSRPNTFGTAASVDRGFLRSAPPPAMMV